jgi:hypothetical protein
MALVWESSVITQAIVDLLVAAHVPSDLKAVYYGDQARIPGVPSATVISGDRSREFNQTGLQYEITLTTFINLYHGQVADLQTITKDLDVLAEHIEATLNTARTLNTGAGVQRIIHGHVSSCNPGFADRGGSLWVAHQLTHRSITRQQVGS